MKMGNRCLVLTALLALSLGAPAAAQQKTVSDDKDWSKPGASLKDTREAEYLIRVGDVDNLGFGWPDGFDPFCGRLTEAHEYPWEPNRADQPGFDRILLSSRFNPAEPKGCGADGYSAADDAVTSKPLTCTIPTAALNRSLSYRRVKACKDYIVSRGIDPGRIIAHGYGPDRPVAPNDTVANRARNRRVEMRAVKL
jgi:hypothetical protein